MLHQSILDGLLRWLLLDSLLNDMVGLSVLLLLLRRRLPLSVTLNSVALRSSWLLVVQVYLLYPVCYLPVCSRVDVMMDAGVRGSI